MNLSIIDNQLQLELEWYEQLWAFNWERTINIPLAHIESITTDKPPSSWTEIRAPGTFLPGVIKAVTYYTSRGKEFWYVTADRDYLVLVLRDESFKRIAISLKDNYLWVERISQAKIAMASDS